MNTERLTELWKLLDSVPAERLDHRVWRDKATGQRCLGGQCTQHSPFRVQGLSADEGWGGEPKFESCNGRTALAKFFGLTNDQVCSLFDPLPDRHPDIKAAYARRLTAIFPRPVKKETPMSAVTIVEPAVVDMTVGDMPAGSYGVITAGINDKHIGMVIHKVRDSQAYTITNMYTGAPCLLEGTALACYRARLLPTGTTLSFMI